MELTIVLSVSPDSKTEEIFDTLDSIPWECDGVDLVIYSEDTNQVRKVIKERNLESSLKYGLVNVLFCDEPYISDETYMNFGIEDCKTDYITFIKPGDTIEDCVTDSLLDSNKTFEIGFGRRNFKSISATCFESRMMPIDTCGIVFLVDFLRQNKLRISEKFIPLLINTLVFDKLRDRDYSEGWGKFCIDELFSIIPGNNVNLGDEYNIPKIYEELWRNHEVKFNHYLRDLLWNRMSRAAGIVVTTYSKKYISSEFYKYLLPENKESVLC